MLIDVVEIQKILPHRFPFLLVDRITGLVPGESIEGFKNITIGEQIFQGHFPDHPIYPGVMIIERVVCLRLRAWMKRSKKIRKKK